MIRFKFLTGDVNWQTYGGKWVSQKLNNGEFDYWIVMELINMDDATGRDNEGKPTYHVQLSAVSPAEAGEHLKKAADSCGLSDDQLAKADDLTKVEILHSYGVSAPMWSQVGDNYSKLMKEAREQSQVASCLFGFFMDGPKNKIGTTGWEALRGDLDSALHRTILTGSPEGRILAKMHGIDPDNLPTNNKETK